jgi:hypothetical protein
LFSLLQMSTRQCRPSNSLVPIRMKHLCKFLRRRSFRTHRPCRRLLLFRTPNRRLRSRLLRIAIQEQRMPAGPPTAKAVREAAFKYNGVANFCGFLAGLPADVSVFDPKLGITRTLVKGGHAIRENVAWFRKRKEARLKSNDRTVVSVEELGTRNSGN